MGHTVRMGRVGHLLPLLLVLLALDADLTGVSRCASALKVQTQTETRYSTNEVIFAGGLNSVGIFTTLMMIPNAVLFFKAMAQGKRCNVENVPNGFEKKSRPYI